MSTLGTLGELRRMVKINSGAVNQIVSLYTKKICKLGIILFHNAVRGSRLKAEIPFQNNPGELYREKHGFTKIGGFFHLEGVIEYIY